MGCGASAAGKKRAKEELEQQRQRLQDQHEQLAEKREELQKARDAHAELLDGHSKRKDELLLEIQEAQIQHEEALVELREDHLGRQEREVEARLAEMHHENDVTLGQHQWVLQSGIWHSRSRAKQDLERSMAEQEAQARLSHTKLVDVEGERAVEARERLRALRSELQEVAMERRDEIQAYNEVQAERQALRDDAFRISELRAAEASEYGTVAERLGRREEALRSEVRDLQRELSTVIYKVGRRDHELHLKDAEVHEVRQSLCGIEGEMDDVNVRLQEQHASVQHVEKALRLSQDIGPKMQAMRSMLLESHAALGQLCSLLEHERAQRQQCVQGLRQQKVRTELLLQLLHHFKARTQELSPRRLLSTTGQSQSAANTELPQLRTS
mmetsp:Transcript_19946/g.46403  ORF Transcript_19946/g.46403 Transcript_19946/m.46403 type:complete len:385 (+) Transcript_19946:228-1382(+)|eukprot:CAMPEP_0178425860 /NCGR_PEP_ID=MMETSP0689_2-20121128/28940_1 /TAXON_ID=160604 /ORGANISM="Amphidinium massartii, Strain CS-259" /LENGTH=384 /DNA_ID=CAMNT_0020047535 /DNA_START=142 /DNA_END=1296 /DNA_ORIENTATION=-